nr:autotransporter outer membrane beta-barrel domain-containing protein [Ipomoea batatas]
MGQNSGGGGNVPEIIEATQIDEESTGGEENVSEISEATEIDEESTGGEENDSEISESTEIDEESTGGEENDSEISEETQIDEESTGGEENASEISEATQTDEDSSGGEENASENSETTQTDEESTGGEENASEISEATQTDEDSSGGEENASENSEATQTDEESTGGEENASEISEATETDEESSGGEENASENSETTQTDEESTGGEENASEISEATQIDEENTGGDGGNVTGQATSNSETVEEEKIKDYYFSKIGKVIDDSMSAYDDNDMANMDDTQENKYKMLKHGCLFLLQMFFFLGLGVDKLEIEGGLHEILFGCDENDYQNRMSKFSKCMVFPGNQIPLVVLKKLIHHSFFKKVALKEKWDKPLPSDLLKSVLYDLILDPVLKMNRRSSSTYTDVLHGLHCRCVGIVEESHHQNGNLDLEVGIYRNYLDPKEGEGQRIPSATTMYSEGIDFKAVSGMAIREIQIKDGCLFMGKVLHLPVFTFNNMTKEMYTSLKAYENDHRLREREVSDYLRFLCDIVRTDQDAALLEQKGVIEVDGSNKILIDEVAGYLKSMACAGAGADAGASGDSLLLPLTSTNLRKVKLDIIQYHLKPWYSKLVTRALLLAFFSLLVSILSVIFSILSYFLQKKLHHH